MAHYYAGIGSRQTPAQMLAFMSKIAARLEAIGYILRSGGADGADSAFEAGVTDPAHAQIFLPWRGFNGRSGQFTGAPPAAYEMAENFHPNWDACSRGARALHARNCQQILGPQLDSPVDFVVCWTPGGSGSGGTGQAIRLARASEIPVYDLGSCGGAKAQMQLLAAQLKVLGTIP